MLTGEDVPPCNSSTISVMMLVRAAAPFYISRAGKPARAATHCVRTPSKRISTSASPASPVQDRQLLGKATQTARADELELAEKAQLGFENANSIIFHESGAA